eukprot:2727548-Lingulodinium_polyedra.AAC.1
MGAVVTERGHAPAGGQGGGAGGKRSGQAQKGGRPRHRGREGVAARALPDCREEGGEGEERAKRAPRGA